MIEDALTKGKGEEDINSLQRGITELRAAQRIFRHDRKQGMAELNKLFRTGTVPKPSLNGRYAGELIAVDIAPGLTQFFQWLTNQWMPWLGKTFNASQQSGDNVFMQDSYSLARFFNPFYRGFVLDQSGIYRCFTFRTYVAYGRSDPDRQVLKIDYDIDGNPFITIRRILDELVQLDRNLYLGKAHVHWWWRRSGGWQTVAYFRLSETINTDDLQSPVQVEMRS